MQTKDGIPTTVTFGFVRTLLALLEQEQPDALVVVFDAPGGATFRSGHGRDNKKPMRAGQGAASSSGRASCKLLTARLAHTHTNYVSACTCFTGAAGICIEPAVGACPMCFPSCVYCASAVVPAPAQHEVVLVGMLLMRAGVSCCLTTKQPGASHHLSLLWT
jgi:hypothetical protein